MFFIDSFKDNRIVQGINKESESIWGLAFCSLLIVCSACFHLELAAYSVIIAYFIYLLLFSKKFFLLVGVVPLLYFSPSVRNNPGTNLQSVFSVGHGLIYIILLIALFLIVLLIRGTKELQNKKRQEKKPALTGGLIFLGIAYLLGGIGYENYDARTVVFGLLEIASIAFFYFTFSLFVDKRDIPKDYFAWILFFGGVIICIEMLQDFAVGNVSIKKLYLGWGMFNNVGCMLNMCLPGPLYLSFKRKHGWLYLLFAFVVYAMAVLTCSRTSAAVGAVILLIGCIITIVKNKGNAKWISLGICICFLFLGIAVIVVFWYKYPDLVEKALNSGYGIEGSRGKTYLGGWNLFQQYPVFGTGFYSCTYYQWGWVPQSFLPPRWHNTYIQLLASCGIVGLAAYLVHRVQTFLVLFKKSNMEKIFIALSGFALIGGSLLDCHFFNFGPGILYGTLLFLAEYVNTKEGEERTI